MTTAIRPCRVRFACNVDSHASVVDKLTGQAAITWRGVPVSVEFALFVGSAFMDSKAEIATIYFQLHTRRSLAPLFTKELAGTALDVTISEAQWNAGTHQHGTFELLQTDTQVDLAASTDDKRTFFWVIHAVRTDGKTITCGCGQWTIEEDGAQNDLAVLGASNPTVAVVDGDLRIKNRTTGEWRNVFLDGAGDAESLQWGPVS